MAVRHLFSKRELQKLSQGQSDVLQYDMLSPHFRVQATHILTDVLGKWQQGSWTVPVAAPTNDIWQGIFKTIIREKGVYLLSSDNDPDNPVAQCMGYLLTASTTDALDLIEVAFDWVNTVARRIREYDRRVLGLVMTPDAAIEELNNRFREHRIGYKFESGELMRVDSEHLHAEAVKPALHLLNSAGPNFAGPLQEFMESHTKYRKRDYKGAMLSASHAFESTLKAICTERGWPYDAQKDTARNLIEVALANGLVPSHQQGQLQGLRGLLESGPHIPRNKTPGVGHGQGTTPMEPPEHLVRYALNLAASNIVFLIESHRALT